jgi:hypothetical protein
MKNTMDWKTKLNQKTKGNNMKIFITGWIMIILAIICVIAYIPLAEYFHKLADGMIFGWWLFAAGFFIAGVFFLATAFEIK